MWMRTGVLRSLLATAALCAAASTAAAAPLAKARTERNVDWVSAGIGGLGAGAGVITLAGVGGEVKLALLYWHGIDRVMAGGDGVYDNPQVTFAGALVTGDALGDGPTNCWLPGEPGSGRAYRADVTSLVTGNGNYAVAGLAAEAGHDGNGASLVVLFDDGNPANDRDLVFFEGNDANIPDGYAGETDGWNALLDVTYPGGSVAVELHAADGQNLGDGSIAFSTFVAQQFPDTPTRWDGLSVPDAGNGRAGGTGALWDIHRFDLSTLFTVPGATTVTLAGLEETDDCLSLVLALVDMQATQPTATPTPSFTPTSAPTTTASATPTPSAPSSPSHTAALSTATPSSTAAVLATATDTPEVTLPTDTPTLSAPLPSPTGTPSHTSTITVVPASLTPTPSATAVLSHTAATATAAIMTATPTSTSAVILTATSTPAVTLPTVTLTPESSPTTTEPSAEATPTATAVATITAVMTSTPGDGGTNTPTEAATPSATPVVTTATGTATAATPTGTMSTGATATATVAGTTPTAVPECQHPCAGDCNGNCRVTIDELILMVNMALLENPTTACTAGDGNSDGTIAIDELVRATNRSLFGCLPVPE